MEPLTLDFTVGCSPAHAFDGVGRAGRRLWWPHGHSVSGDPGLCVTFEPRPGGRIYERTPAGEEHDWGEVLAWEPPRRLAYLWHLRQDQQRRDRASRSPSPPRATGRACPSCTRGWERLGDRAAPLRDRNRTGWAGLVPHYIRAAEAG